MSRIFSFCTLFKSLVGLAAVLRCVRAKFEPELSRFVLMPSSDCWVDAAKLLIASLLAKLLAKPNFLFKALTFLKPASIFGREEFVGRSFS